MSTRTRAFRERVLAVSNAQAGTISRGQLLGLGLSSTGIWKKIQAGDLHRVYQGSYSLMPEIDRDAVWWAGVLAAGGDCALSHMSAAHAWGIARQSGPTDVTRRTSGGRKLTTWARPSKETSDSAVLKGHSRIPILKVHHSRNLDDSEVTECRGIPITTVARTFVDIAGLVGKGQLERLLHEASRMKLLKFGELRTVMDRARGKKGVKRLREIIDDWDPQTAWTRNDFEKYTLDLYRTHGMPTPLVNRMVAGHEVDFFWPDYGLIVEIDGAEDHSRPLGIERDKDRDSYLQLKGFLVLRLTWTMLKRDPVGSMRKVRDHLELCRRQGRRANEGWGSATIGNR